MAIEPQLLFVRETYLTKSRWPKFSEHDQIHDKDKHYLLNLTENLIYANPSIWLSL